MEVSKRTPKAGRGAAILAAVLPGAIMLGNAMCASLAFGKAGVLSFASFQDPLAVFVLVAAALGTAGMSALLVLSARGRAVPAALPIGLALLPWTVAALGSYFTMSAVMVDIQTASPESPGTHFARALSRALYGRMAGTISSGTLLACGSVCLAMAARARKAKGRSLAAAVGGALSALPALGAVGYTVVSGPPHIGFFAVMVSLPLVASVVLGAGAMGDDGEDRRSKSAGLAVAACFSGGLGLAAIAHFASDNNLLLVFAALADVPWSDRASFLAASAPTFRSLQLACTAGLALAFLPAVVVAAFAARRRAVWPARIASALAAVLLGALPLVFTQASTRTATAPGLFEYMPWEGESDFIPFESSCGVFRPAEVELLALPGRSLRPSFEPIKGADLRAPAGIEAAAAELRRLIEHRAAKRAGSAHTVGIAPDTRLTGAELRGMVQAASSAGARTLVLYGRTPRDSSTDAALEDVPYLGTIIAWKVHGFEASLDSSLEGGCAGDGRVSHCGTVGGAAPVKLEPWPGRGGSPDVLTNPGDGGCGRTDTAPFSKSPIVCLAISDAATPTALSEAIAMAKSRGYEVVLVPSPSVALPAPTEGETPGANPAKTGNAEE